MLVSKFCAFLDHFDEGFVFSSKISTISTLDDGHLVYFTESDQKCDWIELDTVLEDSLWLWPVWSVWH